LACTRPLRAGETALLVPRTVWLTAATAAASPLGPHLAGQPAWASLALYLLAERADPGSRWAPYLALLPPVEELHSPVLWSAEEELRELSGSQLGASAAAYRAYCADTWAQLAAGPLARAGELLCPPAVFNEHAFLWAFATLRARCLPPCDSGEDIALVPGLDLVNYARGAGPAWLPARAPGGFLARLAPGDAAGAPPPALALQPSRAMAQGEQLVGSYGEGRVDSQLALDFGFVDPDAPVPGYLLQLSLSEEDRFLDDKADVVSLARLPPSPQFALTPGAPPPQDLRAFLRLMHLGGTDAFLLEPIFRDNCWAILSEPVSLANEQAACASMIQGCAAALEGYPTGVREDQEALRAPGSHRRELVRPQHAPLASAPRLRACLVAPRASRLTLTPSQALRVRMGEKRALQACMESFQSALAGAPQLEYYQERRLRSLKLLDESGKTTFDPCVPRPAWEALCAADAPLLAALTRASTPGEEAQSGGAALVSGGCCVHDIELHARFWHGCAKVPRSQTANPPLGKVVESAACISPRSAQRCRYSRRELRVVLLQAHCAAG